MTEAGPVNHPGMSAFFLPDWDVAKVLRLVTSLGDGTDVRASAIRQENKIKGTHVEKKK